MANRRAAVSFVRGAGPHPRHAGFTLLEILLVLAIVAVLATTAVVGFGGLGQSSRVQAEAEQLAMAIELARQKALRRNEVWGLYVEETSYRFKPSGGAGSSGPAGRGNAEGRLLAPRTADQGIRFQARSPAPSRRAASQSAFGFRRPDRTEQRDRGRAGGDGDDEDEAAPSFAIYPDGAMTPVQIVVTHKDAQPWVAQSDGLERVRALSLSDAETQRRRWR